MKCLLSHSDNILLPAGSNLRYHHAKHDDWGVPLASQTAAGIQMKLNRKISRIWCKAYDIIILRAKRKIKDFPVVRDKRIILGTSLRPAVGIKENGYLHIYTENAYNFEAVFDCRAGMRANSSDKKERFETDGAGKQNRDL